MLTPAPWALAMALAFLMVLPNEIADASAPASRHSRISSQLAASKQEPSDTRRCSTGSAGLAFTA